MTEIVPPSQDMTWKGALRHHAPIVGLLLLLISPLALAAYGGVPEGQPVFWGMVAGWTIHDMAKSQLRLLLFRWAAWIAFWSMLTSLSWTNWWFLGSFTCVITFEVLAYRQRRLNR